jgi:hypothetical protein
MKACLVSTGVVGCARALLEKKRCGCGESRWFYIKGLSQGADKGFVGLYAARRAHTHYAMVNTGNNSRAGHVLFIASSELPLDPHALAAANALSLRELCVSNPFQNQTSTLVSIFTGL